MVTSGPRGYLTGEEGIEAVWQSLCQSVSDCAEGFAATDPMNTGCYRDDAAWFCNLGPPVDAREMLDRYAKAAGLRESWSALVVTSFRRV